MKFTKPELVADCIQLMKDADQLRSPYRALVAGMMNGDPPWTPEEEKENKIQVNVNWKNGSVSLLAARQQYENAFLTTGNYFDITIPNAPPSKAQKWSGIVTTQANKILKNSRPFLHTMREKFGSICLHGIGPQMWPDEYAPIPYFVAMEDILVPTDTLITLENLTHFAVRRRMTPGQLFRKTIGKGKNMDTGWNLESVKDILDSFKDLNQNENNWNWYEHPEELSELWKQNQTYNDSDATPVIKLWDFYFQGQEDETCWYRVIVQDDDCSPGRVADNNDPPAFVYQKDAAFADNLDQLIHVQFGDGNNQPPFKWYAVRSIGWLLYDVVSMMNRLQCQFAQKVHEDLMNLYRCADPVDRSRLDKIYMGLNQGIVPEGLTFVTRQERPETNVAGVEMLQGNYRQYIGESTSAYTQDIDNNTNKERTATEVQALLSQTAKMTGSMLNLAYIQEKFAYQEICRRLTQNETPDFTCKKFRAACIEAGVAEQWLDSSRWEIEPERVLGQGNMQLEQAQAKGLLDIRSMLNPEGQAIVLSEYVFALTHDPKRTEKIAPRDGAPHVSDSVHDTELAFSAFMSGVPITPKPGTNAIEVIETMLKLMGGVIQGVMQGGGVGTPAQAHGLDGAELYTQAYIQMLAQDKSQKERVTAYGKALGKMMNEVKGMHQRQDQAAKAQQGPQQDPEAMASMQAKQAEIKVKLQGKQAADALKLKSKTAADQQKLGHKQQDFEATQKRKNIETLGQVQRETMMATVQAHAAARTPEPKEKK
jgi:hypothetical protein